MVAASWALALTWLCLIEMVQTSDLHCLVCATACSDGLACIACCAPRAQEPHIICSPACFHAHFAKAHRPAQHVSGSSAGCQQPTGPKRAPEKVGSSDKPSVPPPSPAKPIDVLHAPARQAPKFMRGANSRTRAQPHHPPPPPPPHSPPPPPPAIRAHPSDRSSSGGSSSGSSSGASTPPAALASKAAKLSGLSPTHHSSAHQHHLAAHHMHHHHHQFSQEALKQHYHGVPMHSHTLISSRHLMPTQVPIMVRYGY